LKNIRQLICAGLRAIAISSRPACEQKNAKSSEKPSLFCITLDACLFL
jgi:hypothetical protein